MRDDFKVNTGSKYPSEIKITRLLLRLLFFGIQVLLTYSVKGLVRLVSERQNVPRSTDFLSWKEMKVIWLKTSLFDRKK